MSMMKDFESTSTLFGGNVPFIEEQYESYLADPASVGADWRAYFDTLRGGAADVAHAPVIESFIRLGKSRKVAGAMVDASTMHKQVLVLQLIGKFRTLGMFHADLDPLKRAEKPVHRRPRPRAPTASPRPTWTPSSTSARSRPARERMRLRDLVAALRETYCRTLGAEYMYITRHRDQALRPGSGWSRSARSPTYTRRAAAAHPRAADRGRDARALPAHQVRRPEALLAARAATR